MTIKELRDSIAQLPDDTAVHVLVPSVGVLADRFAVEDVETVDGTLVIWPGRLA